MKSPITGKEMILMTEKRVLKFKNESFEILFHYYRCEDSKEQFTDNRLDELNISQVYHKYGKKDSLKI